jgi:hypothetical protein
MCSSSGRGTCALRGRPRHGAGPHLCKVHSRRSPFRPGKHGQEVMYPDPNRSRIMQGSRLRQETSREDRGTALSRTRDHLTAAFSTARPSADQVRACTSNTQQSTIDFNARSHDYRMFKSMMDSLTDLAQSRLLGIIRNNSRLVEALPGAVNRHRALSTATPTHPQATTPQEAAIHMLRTRTTRAPKSTTVT